MKKNTGHRPPQQYNCRSRIKQIMRIRFGTHMGDFFIVLLGKEAKGSFFGSIVETYFPFSRYFSFGLFNSIGLGWCFACNNVR